MTNADRIAQLRKEIAEKQGKEPSKVSTTPINVTGMIGKAMDMAEEAWSTAPAKAEAIKTSTRSAWERIQVARLERKLSRI